MSQENEAFDKALERRKESRERDSRSIVKKSDVWYSAFWWGWQEAMDAKFDDSRTLRTWRKSSKHLDCPCNEEKSCTGSCPHGRMWMSGYCKWCADKYEEIEKEYLD